MENKNTTLLNDHLKSLQGMQEASTDEFFYTRLKTRMEKKLQQQGWVFPLKPVWVVGILVFLLIVNGFMLKQKSTMITTKFFHLILCKIFVEEFYLSI